MGLRVIAWLFKVSRVSVVSLVTCGLLAFGSLDPNLSAQTNDTAKPAILQGRVLDAHQRPIAGATVHLRVQKGTQTTTSTTDSNGGYRFSSVKPGQYSLRAEMAGLDDAVFSPLFLKPGETKRIDLAFSPSKSAKSQTQPEFFDEPQFTVAGVSDTTNFGGHGSDTVVRTTESLAKETVALSGVSSPASSKTTYSAAEEKSLLEAVTRNPESFEANHNAGSYLVFANKAREGVPYLERAAQLKPGDYQNSYQLALACASIGDYARARADVEKLLARDNKAELHHLLADIEEKQGHPVEAVREYQRAAELSASEPNLFDWGAELLMHSAVEPAIEVFTKGNRLFPLSSRMLMGLGVAQYGRGSYEEAVKSLCLASDLNPDDPTPYLFLGRLQAANTVASHDSTEKLARFARLQPNNALAAYYHAVSLWRQRKGSDDATTSSQVESLLEKAVQLDPKLAPAYLQLGILHAERKDLPKATSAYQTAIEADPRLEQAHYRLAQAYRQAGEPAKAQKELQTYEALSKEAAEQVVRDRHDIQQFVYTLRDTPTQAK
jgi:tetratricopeptide (TPR) repeat protein